MLLSTNILRKGGIVMACLTAATTLAACGPSTGYYDARGNYVHDTPYNRAENPPDTSNTYARDYYERDSRYSRYQPATGYYDRDGFYVGDENMLPVPQSMFPPRGMCRVWFRARLASDQPPIESCSGIEHRVPAGAYVIYGG